MDKNQKNIPYVDELTGREHRWGRYGKDYLVEVVQNLGNGQQRTAMLDSEYDDIQEALDDLVLNHGYTREGEDVRTQVDEATARLAERALGRFPIETQRLKK